MVQRLIAVLSLLLIFGPARAAQKSAVPAPSDDAIPQLASSFASRLASRTLRAPDGTEVAVGSLLDAHRTETCLRTIGQGGGWPASWLLVSDSTKPYDLILRVALAPDGSIEDPATIFLAPHRSDWDDDSFDAAFKTATGAKPPREKQRNVVIQSFTRKTVTDYVYDLPATGKGAKGLLALLPEGSLIREAPAVDLKDGQHHTLAVVLMRPHFVPADCTTAEGRRIGHRDSGGVVLVLTNESAVEDKLDITDVVRSATGGTFLPRFACEPGDDAPGAIDALVDSKMEARESIRLLHFGPTAESRLDGLPLTVGIKKDDGAFKLYAHGD